MSEHTVGSAAALFGEEGGDKPVEQAASPDKEGRADQCTEAAPCATASAALTAAIEASELTPDDAQRASDVLQHRRRVPPANFKRPSEVTPFQLVVRHPGGRIAGDLALMSAMGTKEMEFLNGLTVQIARIGAAGPDGGADAMDFALSVVKGIEPRDQIEAMLAAQMAATHLATVHMASRVISATSLEVRDSTERSFNRLARSFTTQVEALKRYRTGGEQKVTVQHQHVNVNEGGQAIVGAVVNGGGGRNNK